MRIPSWDAVCWDSQQKEFAVLPLLCMLPEDAATTPLTAASCVCAYVPQLDGIAEFAAPRVSAFLDETASLTLDHTAKLGSVRLLERLMRVHHDELSTDRLLVEHWLTGAMETAAREGHDPVVKRIVEYGYPCANTRAMRCAAARGDLELVQWLYERRSSDACVQRVAEAGAEFAHLDVVKWAVGKMPNQGDRYCPQLMALACQSGHLRVMQWLHDNGMDGSSASNDGIEAARNGHLHVLEWLHETGKNVNDGECLKAAIASGKLGIVQYLVESRATPVTAPLVIEATTKAEVFLYLESRKLTYRIPCDAGILYAPASQGRLDQLQRLLVRFPEVWPNSPVMDWAAASGSVEVVVWIQQQETEARSLPVTHVAMEDAAYGGHLELLKWYHLHVEDCKWTSRVMNRAAAGGHVDVLAWLLAHRPEGCLTNAITEATRSGHLHILQWVDANATVGWATDALLYAPPTNFLQTVRWIHDHYPHAITSRVMDDAVADGHFSALQYLYRCGIEPSPWAIDQAVRNGHLDIVIWLHENHLGVCTEQAIANTPNPDHVSMLKWLRRNYPAFAHSSDNLSFGRVPFSIEVLEFYFESRGQRLSDDDMEAAAKRGDLWLLTWVGERYPGRMGWARLETAATRGGHAPVVLWLSEQHQHETNWRELARVAAGEGDVSMLEWICTTQAMDNLNWLDLGRRAIRGGVLHSVQWIDKSHAMGPNAAGLVRMAAGQGNLEILRWFCAQYPQRANLQH